MLSRRSSSGDSRRRLRRWGEVELPQEEVLVAVRLGVTAQDQGSAVGGWAADIEHLDGGKLVEHRPRGEAGRQRPEPGAQRDVQTIGEERPRGCAPQCAAPAVIDRP